MKYVPPKFEKLNEMASIDVGRLTENEARAILEGIRWPNGIACPHCGSIKVKRLQAKSEKVRDGVIQCNDCRGQFTVTVGTIMQGSHITLRQWIQAFYSMCSHKKGVSALQLQRNLGLGSYKSAWHLAHRIRAAMSEKPQANMLRGIIEVDETYVGGKPRKDGTKHKRGKGTKKTPVLAIVERNGRAVSRPMDVVNSANLRNAVNEVVGRQSTIMSDDLHSYRGIGQGFAGGHKSINHSMGQYADGDISTNTVESYFALLKRGVHGTFHHISKKHLHRYCDEFACRWNNREVSDGERTVAVIRGIEGKSLPRKQIMCSEVI
jgi:transposase-like protein